MERDRQFAVRAGHSAFARAPGISRQKSAGRDSASAAGAAAGCGRLCVAAAVGSARAAGSAAQ